MKKTKKQNQKETILDVSDVSCKGCKIYNAKGLKKGYCVDCIEYNNRKENGLVKDPDFFNQNGKIHWLNK